jgi:hypothetical protein
MMAQPACNNFTLGKVIRLIAAATRWNISYNDKVAAAWS